MSGKRQEMHIFSQTASRDEICNIGNLCSHNPRAGDPPTAFAASRLQRLALHLILLPEDQQTARPPTLTLFMLVACKSSVTSSATDAPLPQSSREPSREPRFPQRLALHRILLMEDQ